MEPTDRGNLQQMCLKHCPQVSGPVAICGITCPLLLSIEFHSLCVGGICVEDLCINPSDTTHFFLYLLREKVAKLLVRAFASLNLTDRRRLFLLLSFLNMIRPASLCFFQMLLMRTVTYKWAETILGIWGVIKRFQ
jgi:hypothetical protein